MNADEIYAGVKVSKGHVVYTATSSPRNDIFKAMDPKGEHTTLSGQEVVKVLPGSENESLPGQPFWRRR
jgi:hypothetical protein